MDTGHKEENYPSEEVTRLVTKWYLGEEAGLRETLLLNRNLKGSKRKIPTFSNPANQMSGTEQ